MNGTGKLLLALPALACALALGTAQAQGATGTRGGAGPAPHAQPGAGVRDLPTPDDDTVAKRDRQFILEAAQSGMFEVQAGQLASLRAADPHVKSYGSMLVDHHTAANNLLVQIANARRVELPAAPPRALRRELEALGKESGAKFDREFLAQVGIDSHKKAIRRFEKAREDVRDPELRVFIDRTLPALRSHLAQAEKLASQRG